MQDDVERVARALCRLNGLCVGFCHTERCPTAVRDYGDQARAAMVATLELAAEDLRELAEEKHGCMEVIGLLMAAGKLQQRAKEVGNG